MGQRGSYRLMGVFSTSAVLDFMSRIGLNTGMATRLMCARKVVRATSRFASDSGLCHTIVPQSILDSLVERSGLSVFSLSRVQHFAAQSTSGFDVKASHPVRCPQWENDLFWVFTRLFSFVSQRGCRRYSNFLKPGVIAEISSSEKLEFPIVYSLRYFTTKNWAEDSSDESEQDLTSETDTGVPDKSKKWHVDRLCPTSLRVRQLKERDYDDIIEREKKLKIVLRIKEVMTAEPGRSMSVQELGKSRDYIGLTNRQIVSFLKRYPAIFEFHNPVEVGKLPWAQFTPEARALYEEEEEIRKNMKVELVTKLRKLLMMSTDRRILLTKIAHLGRDLGLPDDFRKKLVYKYPKYFRVIESEDAKNKEGRVLELVKWSDRLAVTEAEKKTQELMKEKALETSPRLEIQLPKRYRLSNKDKYVIYKFHELECPSPFQDSSHLHPASAEAEKRAVLVVQELLSLTLEKRVNVDHLTHFRKEFQFSNQVRGMLVRHPEHFYVSRKGARDTVFLRDAFEGLHVPGQRQEIILKDKHPLVLVKEKFAALMAVKRAASGQESADTPEESPSQVVSHENIIISH